VRRISYLDVGMRKGVVELLVVGGVRSWYVSFSFFRSEDDPETFFF